MHHGKRYALLTYHGTFLHVVRSSSRLCHLPLGSEQETFEVLYVQMVSTLGSKDTIVALLQPESISRDISFQHKESGIILKCPEGYATPLQASHDLEYATQVLNAWEFYFPVDSESVEILHELTTKSHYFQSNQVMISPEPIRIFLSQAFRIWIYRTQLDLYEVRFTKQDGETVIELGAGHEPHNKLSIRSKRCARRPPTIYIEPLGNLGNRALQFLVAERLRMTIPGATIENIHLQELGIFKPSSNRPTLLRSARSGRSNYWLDYKALAKSVADDCIDHIIIDGFPYNVELYPERNHCRMLLPSSKDVGELPKFSENELICNIRGGEILEGVHPDYFPLPPKYYELLQIVSGLNLVFYGQLDDNNYTRVLRSAFPRNRFIQSGGAMYDFEVLRRSPNIAISISTFSWLAAWLGNAKKIYVPVGGMFSPIQHPGQNYLPTFDERYEFILLPFVKSRNMFVEFEAFDEVQARLSHFCVHVSSERAQKIVNAAKRHYGTSPQLAGFNDAFYLAANPSVINEVVADGSNPTDHYINHGSKRRLVNTIFDPDLYLRKYPNVSMAIAHGEFRSPEHHYIEQGAMAGYSIL